jgi:hypothetical protein
MIPGEQQEASRRFIPYEIPIEEGNHSRSGRVRLVLPEDMTTEEAERICEVIRSLAFADPAERHPGNPDKPAEQE